MISNIISTVIDKIFPDAEQRAAAKLKVIELEHSGELARIVAEQESQKQINETMRAEYSADDKFKSSWRPLFGYVMALSFAGTMGALIFALINAIIYDVAAIKEILSALTELFFAGFAVLGISVYQRSQDKKIINNTTQANAFEKISSIFKKN